MAYIYTHISKQNLGSFLNVKRPKQSKEPSKFKRIKTRETEALKWDGVAKQEKAERERKSEGKSEKSTFDHLGSVEFRP